MHFTHTWLLLPMSYFLGNHWIAALSTLSWHAVTFSCLVSTMDCFCDDTPMLFVPCLHPAPPQSGLFPCLVSTKCTFAMTHRVVSDVLPCYSAMTHPIVAMTRPIFWWWCVTFLAMTRHMFGDDASHCQGHALHCWWWRVIVCDDEHSSQMREWRWWLESQLHTWPRDYRERQENKTQVVLFWERGLVSACRGRRWRVKGKISNLH